MVRADPPDGGGRAELTDLVGTYLDDRFALDPVRATIAGVHDHDHRLGDLSADGFAERQGFVATWLGRFDAVDPVGLAPAAEIDRDLLLADLRAEQALLAFERWRRQPGLYSDLITRGAYYTLIREERPPAERLAAIAERLAQAPAALDAARTNLDPGLVPPVWVEIAIETARAGASFVRSLPAFTSEGSLPALGTAATIAARELDAYADWLRRDLLPGAAGSFAIGPELFDVLLGDRDLVPYDHRTLGRFGDELYRETESQLVAAARALGDDDWRASVARLRDDHPAEEDLVAAYRAEMERSREASVVTGLATFPEGESLEVEPMPEFSRFTYPYAAYVGPGPFERSRHGRFWVTLPAADDAPEIRRERLRGHPRQGIGVIACHEGYPGHHLQLAVAASGGRAARKAVRSNLFIEGWGLYVEELMTELGHLAGPETRLLRLKDLLWRAARVRVDIGLATGDLSFDQAVALLVEGPRLERPNAIGEVRRYTLDPGQPSSYALGRAAILDLRDRAKRAGWGMREFHDRLLATGSLPPALAARELGLP